MLAAMEAIDNYSQASKQSSITPALSISHVPLISEVGAAISVNSAVWCNNVISLVKTSVVEEPRLVHNGGCSCCWAWCGAAQLSAVSCQLSPASAAAAIVSLNCGLDITQSGLAAASHLRFAETL